MSETKVKKSFMDKFTGFFYKTGHILTMIIAYVGVILLALISGVVAGHGGFSFTAPGVRGYSIAFVISIVLLALSLIFSFIKKLRKFSDYFFATIGLIACVIIALVSGLVFFQKQNADWTLTIIPGANAATTYPKGLFGGLFIASMILIGLVVIGGIAYAISMADNRKKEKALKQQAQNN